MRNHKLLGVVVLFGVTQAATAYGACGNMTLCVKNPPFAPSPPSCTQYQNYCSYVQPDVQTQLLPLEQQPPQPQSSAGPGYSIHLENLTSAQLQKILDQLGVIKGKVGVPQ